MNINHFRLIISDLDGTLVKYGSDSISPAVKEALARFDKQGVKFTVATGRSWLQTKSIARELCIDIPVILQAGAIVFDPVNERALRTVPLRPDLERRLRLIADSETVDQFCLNEAGSYYTTTLARTGGGRWLLDKSGETCSPLGFEANPLPVLKHLFIGPEGAIRELEAKIRAQFTPVPNMILWPPDNKTYDWFLEVFDPESSKGRALLWLAVHLKIGADRVMAFGDGFNDLDMLEEAGLGVAMDEAPEPVRTRADLVIPGPEREGMARFLNGKLTVA